LRHLSLILLQDRLAKIDSGFVVQPFLIFGAPAEISVPTKPKPPTPCYQRREFLGILASHLELCAGSAVGEPIIFIQVTPSEYRFDLKNLDEYIRSRRNQRKSAVK
jgi:hypothetical protein